MRSITLGIAALAISAFAPASLLAELPPGAYEELLKDAEEVLDVKITKVTQTSESNSDTLHFTCDAAVLKAIRSKAGLKNGDNIQFESYYVTEATRQRGWAGPKPPPKLSVGQTWKIYLNPGETGKPLTLAAYGRSFEPQSQTSPDSSPDRLGVNAWPASGGGLQIASVNRRSIADKLGLRPGDRVLEINGTPTNTVAEVGPAIAQNQDRVEIKFNRNGETIELTLKR